MMIFSQACIFVQPKGNVMVEGPFFKLESLARFVKDSKFVLYDCDGGHCGDQSFWTST